MENIPLPDLGQMKDYGLVGIVFWLVGKFGQKLLDFMLTRFGLNTDRRNTNEDDLRKQVEVLRSDLQEVRVEVGILRRQKDIASDIGEAFIERMKETGVQDAGLTFLAETLIKFSKEGDENGA